MKEPSLFEFNDGGLTWRGMVRSEGGGGRGYAEVEYSIGKLNYFCYVIVIFVRHGYQLENK